MMSVRNPSIRPDVDYASDDDDESGHGDHDYMGQNNPMYAKGTCWFVSEIDVKCYLSDEDQEMWRECACYFHTFYLKLLKAK